MARRDNERTRDKMISWESSKEATRQLTTPFDASPGKQPNKRRGQWPGTTIDPCIALFDYIAQRSFLFSSSSILMNRFERSISIL